AGRPLTFASTGTRERQGRGPSGRLEPEPHQHRLGVVVDAEAGIAEERSVLVAVPEPLVRLAPFRDGGVALALGDRMAEVDVADARDPQLLDGLDADVPAVRIDHRCAVSGLRHWLAVDLELAQQECRRGLL